MLKAVIVDFDGLIIDTEVVWYRIYRKWFQEQKGYDLSVQEFLVCVGSNAEDLYRMLECKGITVDRKAFALTANREFMEISSTLPPRDGVEDFLRAAKEHGLKVALATSAGKTKPYFHLERLNLLRYFDEIVTAELVMRIKPYPDLFLKALELLKTEPEEALVLEDSQNGLEAGKRAGIRTMIIENDVTKFSDFDGCYRKTDSLEKVDLEELIHSF